MFALQKYRIYMDIGISKRHSGMKAVLMNPQGNCNCYSLTYTALAV